MNGANETENMPGLRKAEIRADSNSGETVHHLFHYGRIWEVEHDCRCKEKREFNTHSLCVNKTSTIFVELFELSFQNCI